MESPAELTVKDGQASVQITWSSSAYDYMAVYGKSTSRSARRVIQPSRSRSMCSTAPCMWPRDTTAMGDPHEIQYTLTFDRSTVRAMKKTAGTGFWMTATGAAVLAAGTGGWFWVRKKRRAA